MEPSPVEEITEPITKKDPKKVEQGKRLAAISKKAKEEKMRRKITAENFSYFPYIIYTVAGVSTFGFVYLLLFGNKKEENDLEKVQIVASPKPQKNSPLKKRFENLD